MLQRLLMLASITICIGMVAVPSMAAMTEADKISVNKTITDRYPGGGTSPSVNLAVVNETEPNDTCAGDPANILVDQVAASLTAGDIDFYTFEGNAGDCVTISTENPGNTDTILEIGTADCSLLLASNDDADGEPAGTRWSRIVEFELPATGTYKVAVYHWSSTGTGDYLLTSSIGSCTPPPPPPANDECARAEPVDCNSVVQGTTIDANNDLDVLASADPCIPFGADGEDVFYEVCVPDGFQLTATLTPLTGGFDPALWFVTDCLDAESCVAGIDAGFSDDPEILQWTNETGGEVCLFVIADSFIAGEVGDFTLQIQCEQVVATVPSTWGSVKADFED